MTETKKRIDWIDIAKAVGITLVVYGHASRGLLSSGTLTSLNWQIVDFAIYTFHMQLFFFLSGMNIVKSRQKSMFLSSRAKAILVPYFVFSIFHGAIQILLANKTNSDIGLSNLLLIPIFPISPFWFLYVLMIFIVIMALFRPSKILLFAAVLMTASSPLLYGDKWVAFEVFYFFAFFVAGALWRPVLIPGWLGALAVVVWLGTVAYALSIGIQLTWFYSLQMLPAAISGIVAVIWIAQNIHFGSKALTFIGRNVIAIYVMHILATAGTRIILKGLSLEDPIIHIISGTIAGMMLPLLALFIFQRIRIARFIGLPSGEFSRKSKPKPSAITSENSRPSI